MDEGVVDEREDVQKKTFAKWINSQLAKRGHPPITDLFFDLRDGTRLLSLLEILTDTKFRREKGKMRVHHLNNVARALKVLEEQKVKLINISNEHIVDGSPKITLGLVWAIILHWQVQGVLKEVMSELQQTNLERTLLAWCRQATQGYHGVDVRNFTTSWRDGLAFAALLHKHRPDLFDWPVMAKKHPYARLDAAFRIAQEHLAIERLLDPEDVNTQNPDKKSVMMYVMCLFQALPHSISMDSLNVSTQSDSSLPLEGATGVAEKERPLSTLSIGLGAYQQTLEEVLTWLLGAEDRLAGMPTIADTTNEVKEQFHELENLMLDLTARQGGIGDVLSEGSRLLRESQMGEEEAEEVRVQMKLLNTRWEELRVKAMDRQTLLHEQLMKLQQEELDALKQWLTKTEDRIANMSELGPTFADFEAQFTAHQVLQEDLEQERHKINSLSNMVVVVDESNSDAACSSLEDELNALGERWAHICEWAEARGHTLWNLQGHWRQLNDRTNTFKTWLDEKEKLLKTMETTPIEDKQEILQEAVMLQSLQDDLTKQQEWNATLQTLSSKVLECLPSDSPAHETFDADLEMMQDRWDILMSIQEAQRQRLLTSGIDLGDESSLGVVSSISVEVAEGTARTERAVESVTAKRQKISGKSQEEFVKAIAALASWFDEWEARLQPSATYSLSTIEMEQLHAQVQDKIDAHKEEYLKVLSLGHSATSETATVGESTVENEIKLTSMKSRWSSLEKLLNNIKLRIRFKEDTARVVPRLEELRESYSKVEEWVNNTQSTTDFDATVVQSQIEECQAKKQIIEEKETLLGELEKTCQILPSAWPEEKEEVARKVQALSLDFKNLLRRITNWELILHDKAKSLGVPETDPKGSSVKCMDVAEAKDAKEALSEDLEELSGWLEKVEQQLNECPPMAPLVKMQDNLLKVKAMLDEVDDERGKLSIINETLVDSRSPLADKVEKLNTRWDRIVDALTNRASDMEKGLEQQRQFEEETSGLRSWLGEVEAFLEAEDAAVGDTETLQAQLEQSNALQDDIETLKSNVENIGVTARHFLSAGDAELRDIVSSQLEDLNSRWGKSVEKAVQQNASLKEALEKSQKVWKEGEDMNAWLQSVEGRVPSLSNIEKAEKLDSVQFTFIQMKNEFEEKKPLFADLNKLGTEMLGAEKAHSCTELFHMFEALNERWKNTSQLVETKCQVANTCQENYTKFQKLCSEESQWLDNLEVELEKSSLRSTDAEEISEALYDLDNFLRSHSNVLDEAKKLREQLTSEGVLATCIENAVRDLVSRYDSLTAKANDVQQRLEGGVEEAQDLERDYVKVLEALSTSQVRLHQYPQALPLDEIEKELGSHQEVLQKMEQRVEVYRSQSKDQAAQRLQDQLSHLMRQYEEVNERVKLMRQTEDFEGKLLGLSRYLSEIDEKTQEMDIQLIDSEYLESQLDRCMEWYRSLSLVKSDVEGVIATGRRIVKEGLTADPETSTMQLDQLKAMYNQLGCSVTEHRGKLEAGLKESRKVENDLADLAQWMAATEEELDRREASHPIRNVQQELTYAQHALDDVLLKKPTLEATGEALGSLAPIFGGDLTAALRERRQDVTHTWERVHKRLSNRVCTIKEQEEKEADMEKFIMKIGEIQAWLKRTETSLSQLEELSPSEREKCLQGISSEVDDYRKMTEEAQRNSDDFVAHGTLVESRLGPELSQIKRRLEHISTAIKRKEAMKEDAMESLDDAVDSYLNKVSLMGEKISSLMNKVDSIPSYDKAGIVVEELEQEICLLEPDVATLISKGDTLTLKAHISDVSRANAIRLSVNNFRKSWVGLKENGEALKKEAEVVKREVKDAPLKARKLITWLDDVSKKLELVNNDEKQLKKLESEIGDKKQDIKDLTSANEVLKKYRFEEVTPMLTLINLRWAAIKSHLSQFQKGGVVQKSIGGKTFPDTKDDRAVVPDFLANVNRLRESISGVSRLMNSKVLKAKKYENLTGRDEELKVVKEELERLKPKVDGVETERLSTMKKANQSQTEQVRRVIDKLREEWAQVNRGYTDRYEAWVQGSDTWRTLHKTIEDFAMWLHAIEGKLDLTANQALTEAKATQKELEKQVTLKHRPSQTLQTLSKEVSDELPSDDARRLQERVDLLLKRWRTLLLDLSARRERIAQEEGSKDADASSDLKSLVAWVDQGQIFLDTPVNVTDDEAIFARVAAVKTHLESMDAQAKLLQELKASNSPGVSPLQLRTVETNLNKMARCLPEYLNKIQTKEGVVRTLIVDADELHRWVEGMEAALRGDINPDDARPNRDLLREKAATYETLDNTFWALSHAAEAKGFTVSEKLKSRMNSIEFRLKNLETQFSTNELMTSLAQRPETTLTIGSSESGLIGSIPVVTATSSLATGTTVTSVVADVIQNVKVEEEAIKGGAAPPLSVSHFTKPPETSSPTLILAALDKSILQIRDWLALMQQMSNEQTAVVGDPDSIRKLIEKQKSVLRELESKKPQLDELVASADSLKDDDARSQLHQQVTKLRDHWDDTNNAVLGRKTQLDAMLNDTHKFESKRVELETWVSRMENRLERMSPIARIPDLLDQQIREQKAFHAEVHQYKHHIELFTQMTGRLVTIYQNDDTRKLKKASDSLCQRFSNLNSNIMSRGKSLYAAMNSSHNLSKALEKFISWVSEAETTANCIEMEVDKMPPNSGTGRRDSVNPRAPYVRLKDLQSEIESHKDVLASLNATGQKLLGTLENQDEALLLHRRLGEMNHRWNTLKYKSIAIRNRLEGTAENWNSLLLSLRELIEWVIRKDTELTAFGPLVGDVNMLANYESDLAVFRRGLDEKQPVIESNLKSGRQLIASEPPLSDTSDSEAGRELDGDARYRGEETTRDLTRSVRREVAKLSEKWAALWERAANQAAQVSLAHKKLGVLQKTVEEVGSRLGESEKVVGEWGPVPHDQNLADQYVHNIRKFRETLPDLQRGIDDVNDQAARFSAHNVPLTPSNSAALHDLNNRWKNLETNVNDQWRQMAGRSREVAPLTPAQLASSVSPPWERATATNKVPYYINHAQETTHWDHPLMMDLLDSLSEYNHIKFSAYRTATKMRSLQKKLALDCAKLQLVTDVFDEHGLRGQNDRLIDVNDMIVVLSTLYGRISSDNSDVNTTLTTDLCLNWLLNVYDSQRTGQMRVLSFRVGLICLCRGHLEEKYRYMFRLIADPNRLVDQRKLGLLLHDCVQVPRQLGEVAAFGGSNIEPSVRSCFTKAGKDRETIEAVHFLTWVQQEPQSLVWLAVLHRVAASESVQHQVKCNICKTYPIVGLRYRCLKCLSFDMCQRCFFEGRSTKSHKITHPMHEYCTATTAGDEMKDFTKALKNKFKSKRSLQKHTKKGYLPVQTVLEGDPLESPSPSPSHNVSSQDMHSRLELYASRLAEVELRTNSNSTPDSEDEHGLIAQYCQSLSSSDAPFPVPKSPLQIMASVDADQKDELEQMIRDLEEENRALQAEYERLKLEQPSGSISDEGPNHRSEAEMLAEAKLLREHKGRLEARMAILEDHNRQLEAQLQRLRQLLVEQSGMGSPNKSGTLQTKSVTASQLAMDSPAKINGHSSQGGSGSAYEGLDQMSDYVRPPPPPVGSITHMGNLFSRAGDLEKAVGNLVASMNQKKESDSLNGNHSDENDYDNTVPAVQSKSD